MSYNTLKRGKMTSHELAKVLLSVPDMPIVIDGLGEDKNIFEVGSSIFEERTKKTPVIVIEIE